MPNPSRALPPVIDKAYGFVLREGAAGTELLVFVPMRPCAALAAAGRAIRAGRVGGFTGRGDTPQGPRQLRERPSPPPSLPREREPDGLAAAGGRSGRGRGGGAPNRKKIRGRVGGPRAALRGIPRVHDTTVRTLLRDGGVGGAAPSRRGRGTDREMVPPSRRRCAPAAFEGTRGRGGGAPNRKKIRGRVGGPERPCEVSLASTTRPCARSSGMGAWGAAPPTDEGEGAGPAGRLWGLRPEGRSPHPNTSKAAGSGRSEGRLTAALTHGLPNAGTLRA